MCIALATAIAYKYQCFNIFPHVSRSYYTIQSNGYDLLASGKFAYKIHIFIYTAYKGV